MLVLVHGAIWPADTTTLTILNVESRMMMMNRANAIMSYMCAYEPSSALRAVVSMVVLLGPRMSSISISRYTSYN
jgi:hypothetical protein